MEQALRVVYSINRGRFWLNCLSFCLKIALLRPLAVRAFLDCMLTCMNRTEAPCQNHWGVESIEVLGGVDVISNYANVCFLYFSARATEGTNETV